MSASTVTNGVHWPGLIRLLAGPILALSMTLTAVQIAHASDQNVHFQVVEDGAERVSSCNLMFNPTEMVEIPDIAYVFRDGSDGQCQAENGCKTIVQTADGTCSPFFFSNENFQSNRIFGLILENIYKFGLVKDEPYAAFSSQIKDRRMFIVIQGGEIYFF